MTFPVTTPAFPYRSKPESELEKRLERLKEAWSVAVRSHPELKKFGKAPWNEQGEVNPDALKEFRSLPAPTPTTTPVTPITPPTLITPTAPIATSTPRGVPDLGYGSGRQESFTDFLKAMGRISAPAATAALGTLGKGFDWVSEKGIKPGLAPSFRASPLAWEKSEEVSPEGEVTELSPWDRFRRGEFKDALDQLTTFDAYLSPEGRFSPQATAQTILGGLGPLAPPQSFPKVPTLRSANVEEAIKVKEAELGRPLDKRERREVEEDIYTLPPGMRGLAEELPWFLIPPAKAARTGIQGLRLGQAALAGKGLAPRVGRGVLRATEMGLKPIEVAEEVASKAITLPFRGLGQIPRIMRRAIGRDPTGPTTPLTVAPTARVGEEAAAKQVRIGDDVVFEGVDGTTGAGKVVGEGTIEINEVSKPYFTVRTATGETVQRPIEAVRLRAADVPAAPTARAADAAVPGVARDLPVEEVIPPLSTAQAAKEIVEPTVQTGVSMAPAVKKSIDKAKQFRELDAPGGFSRFLDMIPGIRLLQRYIRPGADETPVHIQTAYVASRSERALFSTKTSLDRHNIFNEADRLFGSGSIDGEITNARFIGAANESSDINGLLLDVAQRPHLYDLTPQQSMFLTNVWQPHNSKFIRQLIGEYGSGVREYPAPKGGVFLSNIDVADDALKALGTTESGAAIIGRGKLRVFKTAAERMAKNPEFKPMTNIRLLQTRMDDWKAIEASKEVFKQGSGGLTRIQVVDLLHPKLRPIKEILARKVKNLRARIDAASTQTGRLTARVSQARTQARQAERRAQPMLKRIEELDDEYGVELPYLSGQVRELLRVASQAEKRGVDLALRVGTRRGKAKAMIKELDELVPRLDNLRRRYEAANLTGYKLVEKGIFRYFPYDEAEVVQELQSVTNSTLVRLADEWRGTNFAGDFSPIAGIQIPVGFLFNPKLGIQRLVGMGKNSIQSRDLLYAFRRSTMIDAISKDFTGWKDFAYWTGLDVVGDTPQEFAGGLLRYIPGFTKANEAMYTVVTRQMKAYYDKQLSFLVGTFPNVDKSLLKMAAADNATMVYPLWNPARVGLSPARAAAFRAMPTSISFVTRPAALISKASGAFLKMAAKGVPNKTGISPALKEPLTPSEKLAVRSVITIAASTMAMSLSSAAISALARDRDPLKAMLEVVDPTSPKFIAIVFGPRYIPLGGAFRSIIKMIYPREVDWAPIPVPFATVGNFVRNRINPAWKTQVELIANKDFYGNTIREGSMPEQVWQSLLYEIEGLIPLALGTGMGGLRRGLPIGEIFEESAAQFTGTNIGIERPYEKRKYIQAGLISEFNLGTFKNVINELGYGLGEKWKTMDNLDETPSVYSQIDPKTKLRIQNDPEVKELTQQMKDEISRLDTDRGKYEREVDKEREVLMAKLHAAWKEAQKLEQDPENPLYEGYPYIHYRLLRKEAIKEFYISKELLRDLFLEDYDKEIDTPFEIGEDEYYRLLVADDKELVESIPELGDYISLETDTGEMNWEEYNRRTEYLNKAWSPEFIEDIRKLSIAKQDLPDFEREYRKAMNHIQEKGWFDTKKDAAAKLGLSNVLESWIAMGTTSVVGKKYKKDNSDVFRRIDSQEDAIRLVLRDKDPDLQKYLRHLGFVSGTVDQDAKRARGWGLPR